MGYDFDDRVTGTGKTLELYKLANEIQKKNTTIISRLGEHFRVELEFPPDFNKHILEFREPFVCIQIGSENNEHILFHYCMDVNESKDIQIRNILIKEFKKILKDIERLKKDKMPYELDQIF